MGYSVRPRLLTSRCSKCFLAEKGGSRTLRGPYGPQTGFEDQRHHRAPSFSVNRIKYLCAYRGNVQPCVYHSCIAFQSSVLLICNSSELRSEECYGWRSTRTAFTAACAWSFAKRFAPKTLPTGGFVFTTCCISRCELVRVSALRDK